MLDETLRRTILEFQRNEITEHVIYGALARKSRGGNAAVLQRIAEDELRHYHAWKKYTETEVHPKRLTVLKFRVIASIFGLTFAIKLMEAGEEQAEAVYRAITRAVPEAATILEEEVEHEQRLVNMIDEEKIGYVGSMVLGLNDALVELTGALAGFTFTLQNARLTGAVGLITGIAASLSMAASEYLSQKSEPGSRSPAKASFYTGIAYVLTVVLLVAPYFVCAHYFMALGVTLFVAVVVIFVFTFFVSVVKDLSFRRMFVQILFMSLGVAAVSFIIGWITRAVLNVDL